jgi:S-formylglutathione hydrolase FrmB
MAARPRTADETRPMTRRALGWLAFALFGAGLAAADPPATGLRFEVTVAPGLLPKPTDGRLLVVLGKPTADGEPRDSIGDTGRDAPPLLGADVNGFAPGVVGVVDGSSEIFPIASLAKLPAGEYVAQAVFDWNADLRLPNAPGNLYGEPQRVTLDPAKGGTVKLTLTKPVPPERLPPDTDAIKYIKLESKLLSAFHGRPMFLRAGVILPRGYDQEPTRKYPLLVVIGGYGSRYTSVAGWALRTRRADLPMIVVHLDGVGPYGDPYQVNSANNGPYGDAVTRELIPFVEEKFRGVGKPYARFTTGTSTGGWVSLALQVFYPDVFNGCWSFAPDPVDFRAYELINIYEDKNAYVNRFGFERPAKRNVWGDTVYDVRHECQLENVLGRGNRWWLSGKDWCAWNAVFGPRGSDGQPKPLWHPKTGAIDRGVTEHWQKYDLRLVLTKNWKDLGPKLKGKLHVYVGDADDYFLNNAVRMLDAALKRADPPFGGEIGFGPMAGHGYHPVNELQAIAERFDATRDK